MRLVHAANKKTMWEALPTVDASARFKTAEAVGSGDWLSAFPSNKITTFSSGEFRAALSMRFGYRQFEPSTKCGDCGQFVDRLGNHCLHCGKYGGWTKRHNLLRDRLFWWCQQGLLLAEREKKGLLGDNRKPADLFISSYLNGRDWAFDFVVRSPF